MKEVTLSEHCDDLDRQITKIRNLIAEIDEVLDRTDDLQDTHPVPGLLNQHSLLVPA